MINVKEVRVGNILQYKGHMWTVEYNNLFRLELAGHEHEGIPLTPEILEKCGFKLNANAVPQRWNKPFRESTIYLYIGLSGNISFTPFAWNYTLEVNHLHQLQNLYFALTGTELNYTP